mgnify:CR=1 FL=1
MNMSYFSHIITSLNNIEWRSECMESFIFYLLINWNRMDVSEVTNNYYSRYIILEHNLLLE